MKDLCLKTSICFPGPESLEVTSEDNNNEAQAGIILDLICFANKIQSQGRQGKGRDRSEIFSMSARTASAWSMTFRGEIHFSQILSNVVPKSVAFAVLQLVMNKQS